jgi:hypothetical protein
MEGTVGELNDESAGDFAHTYLKQCTLDNTFQRQEQLA